MLGIYKGLRREKKIIQRYGKGTWALVTGGSDGIGKAMAISLAKRGFNIVIISRTQQKLINLCKHLSQSYNIQAKYITCNFLQSNKPQFYNQFIKRLQDLKIQQEVSILVNNVGLDVLNYYHNHKDQEILDLITVNCYPIALLTKKILDKFINRDKRSAIINVSSVAGQIPIAMHNVYSASKAFNDFLSRSLAYQYPNIDIISLRPSEVSTAMTFHKKDIFTISPQQCSEGCLKDLGYQLTTNGNWKHAVQSYIYNCVPQSVFNFAFKNIFGPQFLQQRKQAKFNLNKKQ